MTIYEMKENVKRTFGEDSHEYGYFYWCFSRRSGDYTKLVYQNMMKKVRAIA